MTPSLAPLKIIGHSALSLIEDILNSKILLRRSLRRVCSFEATRSIFLLGFIATGTGVATQSILFPFCKAWAEQISAA